MSHPGPEARAEEDRPRLVIRVSIVFVAAVAIWWLVSGVRVALLGTEYGLGERVLEAVLTSALVVLMVWAARRHLDCRGWAGIGLPSLATHWRSPVRGIAAYAVPAVLALVIVTTTGLVAWTLDAPVPELLGAIATLMLLVLLLEALPEELIFRGYLYRNLATVLPRGSTVVVQTVLFTAWGYAVGAGGGLDRLALFLVGGIVLGTLRAVAGNVWVPLGFHLSFQTFQQLFSPAWEQITVTQGAATLETLALGGVPLLLGTLAVERLRTEPMDWRAREPDPHRATGTPPRGKARSPPSLEVRPIPTRTSSGPRPRGVGQLLGSSLDPGASPTGAPKGGSRRVCRDRTRH